MENLTASYKKGPSLQGETVQIHIVDNNHPPFNVHADVLRRSSDYFAKALDENWKEGKEGIISMEEVHPAEVCTYLQWLYSGQVFQVPDIPDGQPLMCHLAYLYAFGERVMDNHFKDCVAFEIMIEADEGTFANLAAVDARSFINIIYEGTPIDSPGRSLARDMHKEYCTTWMEDADSNWNHEFLHDLAKALMRDRSETPRDQPETQLGQPKTPLKWCDSPCYYHHHHVDETCWAAAD